MEQTQQFCLHFLLEMHTLTPSEPRCHLQSEKVCSSQSKSILCLTASPTAGDSKILLNIYQWLLSNYHQVVLLRLQHLFRSKEVFLSAAVLHSITGTKAGEHKWHQPGPLPTGSALCTISHASCSTGTQLATPNGLWEHKAGKFLVVLSSTDSSMPSRILIPQLQNTNFFTEMEGFSWSDSL